MFEVGVAFNAKFSGESTDVSVRNVVRAMIANFDYNPNMQYVMKSRTLWVIACMNAMR